MHDLDGQPELEPIRFGSDGELVSGKFCAYCGNQNSASDHYCRHCAEYIADQGPDLPSRLARISRRARTARPDQFSFADRIIAAHFDRFDLYLTNLGTYWDQRLVSIAEHFMALKKQTQFTLQYLLGKPPIDLDNLDRSPHALSTNSVKYRPSLSIRLARVQRHASSYSSNQWGERNELNWQPLIVLVIGWFIAMAMFIFMGLILTHHFFPIIYVTSGY